MACVQTRRVCLLSLCFAVSGAAVETLSRLALFCLADSAKGGLIDATTPDF